MWIILSQSSPNNSDDCVSVQVNITTNAPAIARAMKRAAGRVALGTKDPDIADAFRQVNAIILGFERRRFETLSRSGGNSEWPDLALSTKLRRLTKTKTQRTRYNRAANKGGFKSRAAYLRSIVGSQKFAILVDTANLRNSLSGQAADSINELLPMGGRVGTRVKYAAAHQYGLGRVPKRRIIVPPPPDVIQRCVNAVARGINRAMDRELGRQ